MYRAAIIAFIVALGLLLLESGLQISGYSNGTLAAALIALSAVCLFVAAWLALRDNGPRELAQIAWDNYQAWRIREWKVMADARANFTPASHARLLSARDAMRAADSRFQLARHSRDECDHRDAERLRRLLAEEAEAARARQNPGNEYSIAKQAHDDEFIVLLHNGKIIAKGFLSPYRLGDKPVVIPRSQWFHLKLDGSKAWAAGIEYTGVVLGKKR